MGLSHHQEWPQGGEKSRNPRNNHTPEAYAFFVASSSSGCKFFPDRKAQSSMVLVHPDMWMGFLLEFSQPSGYFEKHVPGPPGKVSSTCQLSTPLSTSFPSSLSGQGGREAGSRTPVSQENSGVCVPHQGRGMASLNVRLEGRLSCCFIDHFSFFT